MNYQKIYDNLIRKGKTRILEESVYTENHHIIPKCLGGTDNNENLVRLTPEEHLVAHLLLTKINPNNKKLVYASNWMTSRVKNNKEYGWVKRKFAMAEKETKTGISRSSESIEKQRKSIHEKYLQGYVNPNLGKHLTEKHKNAISNSNKGKHINEKSKSDLNGFILRYGEIEGAIKYKEVNKKKNVSSLSSLIEKYGEEEGTKQYNIRREKLSKALSGSNNHFFGKTHTLESKEKISMSTRGKSKIRTNEHNIKIGLAHKGRKHEIVKCPHCDKEGGKSLMKRWHFEKCKLKRNIR